MSQRGPRIRRARLRAGRLLAVLVTTATAGLGLGAPPAVAAPASAPWGSTGASYLGGIVCALPGSVRVPLVAWSVDGSRAFAVGDVRAVGSRYGAAPAHGTASSLAPGQDGIPGRLIAPVAYLIAHHGSGSAAEIAETSAEVAAAAGGGAEQAACLGQQGTSRAHAAALWADAQRYAGPYTLTVSAPSAAAPQVAAKIGVRVVSAAGVPTPGIPVTVTAAGQPSTVTTGADGTATASVVTPRVATTPITAAVSQPIGLTALATRPASVTTAVPVTATAHGTLTADLHPHPSVTATPASALLLAHGAAAITVHLTGTASYPGSGTVSVVGPVQPKAGALCSSLHASDFASAPAVWKGTFVFARDGDIAAGTTGALGPGCYATESAVSIPSAAPPVTASSNASPGQLLDVSTVTLTQQAEAVAPPGVLSSTLTADDPGGATVTGRLTAYGPLPTTDGRCTAITDWTHAKAAGTSSVVRLAGDPSRDKRLRATVGTPAVTATGCYTVTPQLTVALDGHSLVVTTPPGGTGTQTLVVAPTVTLADDTYDGTMGHPMTATATVVGTYSLAGTLHVGLVSAPVPFDGCRSAQFPDLAPATYTTTRTRGDGAVVVHTPVASRNLCYAVSVALVLDANHAVHAMSPAPESDTVFLAGVSADPVVSGAIPHGGNTVQLRALVVFAAALALMLLIFFVLIGAARRGRRPDPPRNPGDLPDGPAGALFGEPPVRPLARA